MCITEVPHGRKKSCTASKSGTLISVKYGVSDLENFRNGSVLKSPGRLEEREGEGRENK